jgi:DNA-binding transcriptional ArsR family regulator
MSINTYPPLAVNDLAGFFKLLSEPNRLRILCGMGLDCVPVSAIIAKTGLSQTNVSFHLRALREAGIVKAERRGGFVYYCLYDYRLLDLLSELDEWRTHRQAEYEKREA